jgi:polar amino acid transport system permease protein
VSFDFGIIGQHMPQILRAAGLTVVLWGAGLIGGCATGFLVAVARRFGPRWLNWVLGLYVEIVRGTPFLIQLFLLYFGGPYAGLSLDPVPAGLIGLSLYGGAYFSEIFRTGFEAVPKGHVEAGECLGLSRGQIVRRVLLPEMTMLVLPAWVNFAVVLLKETAILSIITVQELTFIASSIGSESYAFVEALSLLALFYWGLVEIAGWLGRYFETRLSRFRFAQA